MRHILRQYVPHATVWAFGSRVNGKAKPTSDLDLVLVGDRPEIANEVGVLREAFAESDLPIKVDVVDWAQASPAFRRIIDEHKTSLQNGRGE